MTEDDPTDEISEIEVRIEALVEIAERCRKFILVSKRAGGLAQRNPPSFCDAKVGGLWLRLTRLKVCRSEMRYLVCTCFHEGRAGRGARDVVTAGGISLKPVEAIDKAQHVRHQDVGDGEGPRQPFASCQHRLHMLEPDS